jgi:hypothetical protein
LFHRSGLSHGLVCYLHSRGNVEATLFVTHPIVIIKKDTEVSLRFLSLDQKSNTSELISIVLTFGSFHFTLSPVSVEP